MGLKRSVIGSVLASEMRTESLLVEERYHHTNGRTSSIIAVVFVFVDAIISLVAIAFVGELVCLHILLSKKLCIGRS